MDEAIETTFTKCNMRHDILQRLRSHYVEITTRFDVASLAIFGSASRDQLRDDSDVDVLVQFTGPATFRGYFGLKNYLETLLGRTVDLVSDKALRHELRPYVEKDLLRVA